MTSTQLPQCVDIERQLIGGLVMEAPDAGEVFQTLRPSDFLDDQNRVAFAILRNMHRTTGTVDAALFAREASQRKEFADNSAVRFLIDRGEQLVNRAHVKLYAAEVLETSRKRRLLMMAQEIARDVPHKPLCELLPAANEMLAAMHGNAAAVRSDAYLDAWATRILNRERPVDYLAPHSPFPIRLRPGRVITVAAPPGAGKTVATQQLLFEALQHDEDLRAVVCQVEMTPTELCDRHLARISGIAATQLAEGTWPERHRSQLVASMSLVQAVSERIVYVPPPFSIAHTRAVARREKARLVCVDYIQRTPADTGIAQDIRQQVNAAMDGLRAIANEDNACVLAVSAVSRQKDGGGSSYDTRRMGMASLKESGELEYGSNDVYLMHELPDEDGLIQFKHVKSRGEPKRDFKLRFQQDYLKFEAPNYCHDFDDFGEVA